MTLFKYLNMQKERVKSYEKKLPHNHTLKSLIIKANLSK